MKRVLIPALVVLTVLCTLSGCGIGGEVIDYDLVFVNDSDSTIVEVVLDFTDQTSGTRCADSCPMKRGESFGFEAGEYPVTLAVYDRIFEENPRQKKLASITIISAPRSGERWYVTAGNGADGLALTVNSRLRHGG